MEIEIDLGVFFFSEFMNIILRWNIVIFHRNPLGDTLI